MMNVRKNSKLIILAIVTLIVSIITLFVVFLKLGHEIYTTFVSTSTVNVCEVLVELALFVGECVLTKILQWLLNRFHLGKKDHCD